MIVSVHKDGDTMDTINLFLNMNYQDSIYKKNISFYLDKFVGFNVNPDDVCYQKISANGIDTFLVVLKHQYDLTCRRNGRNYNRPCQHQREVSSEDYMFLYHY